MSSRAHAARDGELQALPEGADELTSTCAAQLAELVRTGSVTAEEVVVAHLDRITEINDQVGALVDVDRSGAVRTARDISARRAAGESLGPLAGVPFVVKDNLDFRGQTTSCGSHAHRGVVALRDAVVVDGCGTRTRSCWVARTWTSSRWERRPRPRPSVRLGTRATSGAVLVAAAVDLPPQWQPGWRRSQ